MANAEQIYRYHVENLRAVKRAVSAAEQPLKSSISRGRELEEEILTKLYALLVAAKIECRLQKLLYQPDGFTSQQRAEVGSESSQLDKWLKTLEVGFSFQYNTSTLTAQSLGFTAWQQLEALRELVRVELRPIIELRNKLAHGQWRYALTNDGKDVSQDLMRDLALLNFTRIRLQSALADYISDAIHELVVARDATRRNFDQHYNRVLETRRNLSTQDHKRWSQKMSDKYERGLALRGSK